jgi:hypothetical protein
MKSKNYALKGLMIAMIALTSCAPSSSTNVKPLNIYQPSILSLEKGKAVITKDGVYTPQTDEVWHSDARYRKLERELY